MQNSHRALNAHTSQFHSISKVNHEPDDKGNVNIFTAPLVHRPHVLVMMWWCGGRTRWRWQPPNGGYRARRQKQRKNLLAQHSQNLQINVTEHWVMASWVRSADHFTHDRAARYGKDEVACSDNYSSVNACVSNSYKCNSEAQRKARQEVRGVSRLLNTTNCGRETAHLKMLTILDWWCSWMRKCLPSMLKAMGSIPDTSETKTRLKNKGGRCSDACL